MSTPAQAPSVPMFKVTIDGKQVEVPRGTNVIEAARKVGIDIPYLCYHHQLSPYGGCRLCLVEIEKMPRLLAACNTLVGDGMVVTTTSEKVKQQRAGSLEFILLNHPLDCPVCDKGGECELQDRVFGHSNALSRMAEHKVHVEDYDLGPLIVRNQDRCIICKRCIKVMEEIVGEPVLEFGQRGVTTEIYTFEHESFAPGFSGNTIRVCPVGALMSKPFRFKARPWELIKTPTLCDLCSVGCNIRADVRENKLLRVVGIENPRVNDGWLCDRGQFGYDYVNSAERLSAPLIRRANGEMEEASWDEALNLISQKLNTVRKAGAGKFAAIASPRATNEDLFALQAFTRGVMASPNIDYRRGTTQPHHLSTLPAPGAIEALGQSDVVVLVGTDLTAEAPVLDLILKRGLLPKKMKLVLVGPKSTALDSFASLKLRCTPGAELGALNAMVSVLFEENLIPEGVQTANVTELAAVRQGVSAGVTELASRAGCPEDEVRRAARLLAGARTGSIAFGQGVVAHHDGGYGLAALQNLAILSGQSTKPGHVFLEVVQEANVWGARLLGAVPYSGPGSASVEKGLDSTGIFQAAADGKVSALLLMGADPLTEHPGRARVEAALARAEFVVVQEAFLSETGRRAHVVLPSALLPERAGTLVNIEGRVQRALRAMDPLGGAQPDWLILASIAEAMGAEMECGNPEQLSRLVKRALETLPPVPPKKLQRVETPAPTAGDAGYPLKLFTGRLMFERAGLQGRSSVIPGLAPEPTVKVNPHDAARSALCAGALAWVTTPYGRLQARLEITDEVAAGTAFYPSGYASAPASALWVEGASVVNCRVTTEPVG